MNISCIHYFYIKFIPGFYASVWEAVFFCLACSFFKFLLVYFCCFVIPNKQIISIIFFPDLLRLYTRSCIPSHSLLLQQPCCQLCCVDITDYGQVWFSLIDVQFSVITVFVWTVMIVLLVNWSVKSATMYSYHPPIPSSFTYISRLVLKTRYGQMWILPLVLFLPR